MEISNCTTTTRRTITSISGNHFHSLENNGKDANEASDIEADDDDDEDEEYALQLTEWTVDFGPFGVPAKWTTIF